MKSLWLRGEANVNERRAPLSPEGAALLIAAGHAVHVETSESRVFSDESYKTVGCVIEPRDSWRTPRKDAVTLGIKIPELKGNSLYGEHVFFAHQYNDRRVLHEKPTAYPMLRSFEKGGGIHYDLEYLTDEGSLCLSSFSTIAGYNGAALAVILWAQIESGVLDGELVLPRAPTSMDELRRQAVVGLAQVGNPSVVLLGASGHCGAGARSLFAELNLPFSKIPSSDLTRDDIDAELCRHAIVVNCMAVTEATPKILDPQNIGGRKLLRVVVDVGCETNSNNPIVMRTRLTTLDQPFDVIEASDGQRIRVIAIDHLPALTPRESSEQCSRQIITQLRSLLAGPGETSPWANARRVFEKAMAQVMAAPDR